MKLHRSAILIAFLAAPAPLLAGSFDNTNPKAGAKLYAEGKCAACHARMKGGDGTQMYLGADHKVKSAAALETQVQYCVTQLNIQWFPEDVRNVAAWLNQRYYKFP
jgi:mono/diheme cytochrome c family protein